MSDHRNFHKSWLGNGSLSDEESSPGSSRAKTFLSPSPRIKIMMEPCMRFDLAAKLFNALSLSCVWNFFNSSLSVFEYNVEDKA